MLTDKDVISAVTGIAHHEPIFRRNLEDDQARLFALIAARCSITSAWLGACETATSVIAKRPAIG